jgi:hypothetical protein
MKTPDISKYVFGGILVSDAAGYYPGLELLNYIYGEKDGRVLPEDLEPVFRRTSQDFARRLVWDHERFTNDEDGRDVFVGSETEDTLRHLLSCLQMKVPNRKTGNWEAAFFFPYTRSLVHWDARRKKNQSRINIERRYYRGGGAMVHKILRLDPDKKRLEAIRAGFEELLPIGSVTPLERLAGVLARQSADPVEGKDSVEKEVEVREDDGLNDLYRDGVRRVLSHTDLSSTARIRALVIWTGFWLATCQSRRAAALLEDEFIHIIVDCGHGAGQLRHESSRRLKDILAKISQSAIKCTQMENDDPPSAKGKRDITGFFTTTCAWTGLLNSFSGKRHFVINLDLLETLVLACTTPEQEVPYEEFLTDILFQRFGIVIGRQAASRVRLLARLDASIFEDNEKNFAGQLSAAGLMHDYSDSTKMVSTRALK